MGKWLEALCKRWQGVPRAAVHLYISTACLHNLHSRCRVMCKFCDEPCRCRCHV